MRELSKGALLTSQFVRRFGHDAVPWQMGSAERYAYMQKCLDEGKLPGPPPEPMPDEIMHIQ